MNGESIPKKGNQRFALRLLALGVALFLSAEASAQRIFDPPRLLPLPDLVISSLSARLVGTNSVRYSWTITNVGSLPANLDGPTASNTDNVKVQAYLSKDTVWGNAGDVNAGGTILGPSPLGSLAPMASKSGTFTSVFQGSITELPHLVLKVDSGNVVLERNQTNNTAAVGIAR